MAAMRENWENPGMLMVATFAALLVSNAVVLYLANLVFPALVVLGTISIPPLWGILHSMGVLALIDTFALPFVRVFEKQRGKMLATKEWMVAYFLLNFAGVWLVTRFPDQFGLGVRSWAVAVVLALVLDVVQGAVMMQLQKVKGKLV